MIRLVIAVFAVTGSSLIMLPFLSAPTHPTGTFDVAPLIWLTYAVGGLITGACLPRRWYVSIAIAWYPLLLITAPYANCSNPDLQTVQFQYYCAFSINMIWVSPVVALLSGLLGSRLIKIFVDWQQKPQRHS